MRIKRNQLKKIIFWALCCDMGLISKRMISPIANVLTDSLHIPGGISTSFSLMFIVVAAMLIPHFGSATLMGIVQGITALSLGQVGSMGALSPIGYIVPGFIIDCVIFIGRRSHWNSTFIALLSNMLAAASASLTANVIVFRLWGAPLLLYLAVALTSGSICGILSDMLAVRLKPIVRFDDDVNSNQQP